MTPPPRRPGQSFESWVLDGVLIRVEIEREQIQAAKFEYRSSGQCGFAGDFLLKACIAEIRTWKMIEPAARRAALGDDSWEMQASYLALLCPEYFEENLAKLAGEIALFRDAIQRQTNLIRWTITPLCVERQPGLRILAAAEAISGPLPRSRIVELCRSIAAASQSVEEPVYA